MAAPMEKIKNNAGIYRRGSRYVVVYRDPSGRQRKRSAGTLAEARALRSSLTADVARGEYRELSRVRFDEYAASWIDTYRGRTRHGCGESTREDYRGALEREAVPFFGRLRLVEIEPRHLKQFVAYLEAPQPRRADHPRPAGLSGGSVKKTIAPVKALLADAVDEGVIRSNPAAGLRVTSAAVEPSEVADDDEGQVKALTESELGALLAQLPDEQRLFFTFLARTALRIGEAIELRWRDVDLGDGWLHVRRRFSRGKVGKPKGRRTRRIRLSPELTRALWQLRKETRAGDDELVFAADRGGRLIPSNVMSRVLKPAAVKAGLGEWVKTPRGERADSWVGFHTFRHTCATMLFRNGWNAVQVQKFLGHSDPGFTLRTYVHLLPEDLPRPDFLDVVVAAPRGGNKVATRPAETRLDASDTVSLNDARSSDVARQAETAAAYS